MKQANHPNESIDSFLYFIGSASMLPPLNTVSTGSIKHRLRRSPKPEIRYGVKTRSSNCSSNTRLKWFNKNRHFKYNINVTDSKLDERDDIRIPIKESEKCIEDKNSETQSDIYSSPSSDLIKMLSNTLWFSQTIPIPLQKGKKLPKFKRNMSACSLHKKMHQKCDINCGRRVIQLPK